MHYSKTVRQKKHEQMLLELGVGKRVELSFDGGQVCTDGGLLLLRKADTALELLECASYCIGDKRLVHAWLNRTISALPPTCIHFNDPKSSSKTTRQSIRWEFTSRQLYV